MPIAKKLAASIYAAILWTVILGLLPFIGEAIWPAEDANDSWQRGYIGLPFVAVFAAPIMYIVGSRALSLGHINILTFAAYTSRISALISIAFAIPLLSVISYIERSFSAEYLLTLLYLGAIVFASLLIPAMVWWAIGKQH